MDQARTRRRLIAAFGRQGGPSWLPLFLSFLVLLAVGPALAQVTHDTAYAGPGKVKVTTPLSDLLNKPSRVIDTAADSLGPVTRADADVVDASGRRIGPVTAGRRITAKNMARAVVRGGFSPYGIAVTAAIELAWCKWETGDLLCDNRQDQAPTTLFVWRCGGSNFGYGSDFYTACSQHFTLSYPAVQGNRRNVLNLPPTCTAQGPTQAQCTAAGSNCNAAGGDCFPLNVSATAFRESQNQTVCPAVPGHPDPQYHVAGGQPDADGKCPSGQYGGRSEDETATRVGARMPPTVWPDVLTDITAKHPGIVDGLSDGVQTSGPGTIPGPSTTTTTTPPGGGPSVTTVTVTNWNITYEGDTITIVEGTTSTGSDGSGRTETKPAEVEFKTCGLPGQPACKIDESGTPGYVPPDTSGLPTVAKDAQARDAALGGIVEPSFGFIGAPPLATCTPFEFANGAGVIDPCNVVDTVREIMSYLWPLVAAWLMLGMIRKAAAGGG